MHLLLIHEIFVTPNEGGGTRHFEFAKFLVQRGYKVTIIASNIDYLSGKKKFKRDEKIDGIHIIYAPTLSSIHSNFISRGFAFLFFSISSFFEALKVKDVDIIMGTSPPLFQTITSFLVAKLKRKKFVFEVRDLWIDFAKELGVIKNKLILSILKQIEGFLYKKSDLIIINSPGFFPYVLNHAEKDKVVLIPNGVSTENFNTALTKNKELEKKLGIINKFVVLYAGNLGVANDIDNIIAAAKLLIDYNDIVFILIGGGIRREEIKKRIHKEKLNNILLLDPVSKSEIPKVISLADVCLATIKDTPLLQIVYPNKVFDYMASGKPTIITISGVIKEVIDKSKGGIYVNPGKPTELKDAVLSYYNDRELAERHGKNARTYVKKHFERNKIAEELEASLLKLLER
jgi:glycosyltransferase involved in cell wall biosynthesis